MIVKSGLFGPGQSAWIHLVPHFQRTSAKSVDFPRGRAVEDKFFGGILSFASESTRTRLELHRVRQKSTRRLTESAKKVRTDPQRKFFCRANSLYAQS